MVNFFRLKKWLFLAFIFFASIVHANVPLEAKYQVGSAPLSSSASGACSAYLPIFLSLTSPRNATSRVNAQGSICYIDYVLTAPCCGGVPSGYAATTDYNITKRANACPAHSVYQSSSNDCGCDAGYQPDGSNSQCVLKPKVCIFGFKDVGGVCTWIPDDVCDGLGTIENSTQGGGTKQPHSYEGPGDGSREVVRPEWFCIQIPDPDGDPVTSPYRGRGCKWTATYDDISVSYKKNGRYQYDTKLTARTVAHDGPGLDCAVKHEDGPEPESASECPIGKVAGLVNGATVCYVPSPNTPATAQSESKKTEKNPDGSKVETTTKKAVDCDGSKCTTTTTVTTKSTAVDGTVTTTPKVTVTECQVGAAGCTPGQQAGIGPGGGAGGSGGSGGAGGTGGGSGSGGGGAGGAGGGGGAGGDGEGERSEFQGTCVAGFKCAGDAIQCSIAREQYRRNCQLFEGESPESIAYAEDSAKGKLGKDQSGDLKGNVERNFSSADFDTSDALGAGACIADKTITVAGRSVTLPFSTICQIMGYMGTILVGISFLLAGRIVIRG